MHVLLTGAASGIGRAIAERLIGEGHTVYAIDIAPAERLAGALPFTADITSEPSLAAIRDTLRERGCVLDAIVNAAGVHAMLSLVEGDGAAMRRLIDVNVTGAMLVNRTFFPLLGERGRIVIVTSEVATLAPLPFNGLYSVSKCALDAYAQALRQELELLGHRVITVRPGAIETPLCRGSLTATEELARTTVLYRKQAGHFLALTRRFMGTPMKPEALARLVTRALTARRPRRVYHKHRSLGLLLLGMLPAPLQCTVIRWLLNRKAKEPKE